MVFHATFNNISVILWWSVLLVEETREPIENHRPVASHWQTLTYNVASSTLPLSGIWTTLVMIGTDYIGSFISNYQTIMTMTASVFNIIDLKLQNMVWFETTKLIFKIVIIHFNCYIHWCFYLLCNFALSFTHIMEVGRFMVIN